MSPDENVNSIVNMLDALPSAPDKYQALQNLKTAVFAIHPSALHTVSWGSVGKRCYSLYLRRL